MNNRFFTPNTCCGCGLCSAVCPHKAIVMKENNKGFIYPVIDETKCVSCGICQKICIYQKEQIHNKPFKIFACVNKNEKIVKSSTSGGAFAALAKWIFDKNGVVFGCAWNNDLSAVHIPVLSMQELKKVQGSKYVQSDISKSFDLVHHYLKQDRYVLFSGTPCQCDALKSFLKKDYEKLFCVEVICHGVPSNKMFKDYIHLLEKQLNGRIVDIHFRDKKNGWGALLKIDYIKNGHHKVKYLKPEESYYYYYYFYRSLFFRESCYSCKYATKQRHSDFTIGDYWGVNKIHPELRAENGASVMIITGRKALATISELSRYLRMTESNFESAQIENHQLISSSKKDKQYDTLFSDYNRNGPEKFNHEYRKKHFNLIIKGKIKRFLPNDVKKIVKSIYMKG